MVRGWLKRFRRGTAVGTLAVRGPRFPQHTKEEAKERVLQVHTMAKRFASTLGPNVSLSMEGAMLTITNEEGDRAIYDVEHLGRWDWERTHRKPKPVGSVRREM